MTMQSDIEAIRALIYSYPEHLDAGDLEGMGRLFAHGTLRGHGEPPRVFRGSAEVLQMYRNVLYLYDGKPSTKHVTTNLAIEVDAGGATASARSYFMALEARPELPLQIIIAGHYHDRFARIDGAWHFTDRLTFTDLVGDLRYHLKSDFLTGFLEAVNRSR